MSGFTDAEYGFEEDLSEDVGSTVSKNIQANTMFTPVRDPHANSPGSRSNTTSPASGSRPNSALRRSLGPSDELLRPTAARLHDEQQLREKAESKKKKPLRVTELTNDRLLRPTKSQESNMKALEDHKAKLKSPTQTFRIAPEDFVVSERLLQMNSTRRHNFEAVQELKNRPSSPPSPKIDPNYIPSERLLKTTVVRQLELAMVEEKKREKEEREHPTAVKSNTPKKEYKPNEHLLKPTQSSLLASKEWEKEKEANKYADDIFWELRKPAERAKSRASTPSKLTNPTQAFISSRREKAVVNTAPETPESAAAEYRPSALPTAPIDQESRLLKPTKAAKLSTWHADNSQYICEDAKIVTTLEMSTKDSYLYRNARPKFMEETVSARAYKANSVPNLLLLAQQERAKSPDRATSPVKPLSDRLLAANKSMLAKYREKHVKTIDPTTAREESWKVNAYKAVIPEVQTSSASSLHVVRPTFNHLLKEVPSESNLIAADPVHSSPRSAPTGVKRISLGGGGSVGRSNGGKVTSTPNTSVNSGNKPANLTGSGVKTTSNNGTVAALIPGRSPNAPAPSYPGVELPVPPVAKAVATVIPPPVPAAENKPAAIKGGAKITKPAEVATKSAVHTPTHRAAPPSPAAAWQKTKAQEHVAVEVKVNIAVVPNVEAAEVATEIQSIVEEQLAAPMAALSVKEESTPAAAAAAAIVEAPVEPVSEPAAVPAPEPVTVATPTPPPAVHHEVHDTHKPTAVKGGGRIVKPGAGNGSAHNTHHTVTQAVHAHAPTLHKTTEANHEATSVASEVHDEVVVQTVEDVKIEEAASEGTHAATVVIEEKPVETATGTLTKKDSMYDATLVEEEGEDEEEIAAAAAAANQGQSKKKNKRNKNKK